MSDCFPGISQSRISHWLLQHGSDLSEQKKRAFYRWYTLEKTTPGTRGFNRAHTAHLLKKPTHFFLGVETQCSTVYISWTFKDSEHYCKILFAQKMAVVYQKD